MSELSTGERIVKPEFRTLDRDEIEAILRRNHVGRLAYARPDRRVDIRQIHYVYEGDWIFGRTSWLEKSDIFARHWWAALAVDEVEGIFDWRSVIVQGGVYRLEPEGSERDIERYERAVAALRKIIPETLTPADPVPFRDVILGIAVQELHGRAASSGGIVTPQPG